MAHEENWEIYPSQLKEEFALFAVDLGVAEIAPVPVLDNLQWLRIVFTTTRDDGMPDEDEAAQLSEVEDWWVERMQADEGLHVARMTCAGRRELFGYMRNDLNDDLVAEARRLFGERYDFEGNSRQDPGWEVYADFLYPDPMAQRRIGNFKVVTQLRHAGDVASAVRPVDHYIYFPDEATRSQYVDEVVEAGFEVAAQEFDDEHDLPWTLHLKSRHTTDLATIDSIVLPLWIRAQQLGANYDGWGSPIVKAEES
jgi:uncharacterized protein (TIGR01619 family)